MTQATTKTKVFLDSSALISAVITQAQSTPIYRLVMLGEQNVLDIRISREVMRDAERFVRELTSEANETLMDVGTIITYGNMATVPDPSEETIAFCEGLTGYRPDARILAASIECNADVLVTYDAKHLLDNPRIAPPNVPVLILRPKDCLDWCYEQWKMQLRRTR